jgi:hypothetical protein
MARKFSTTRESLGMHHGTYSVLPEYEEEIDDYIDKVSAQFRFCSILFSNFLRVSARRVPVFLNHRIKSYHTVTGADNVGRLCLK